LGHATRCIPIIQTLQKQGYQVLVAVNQQQQNLLEQELNNVRFIFLEGYKISYSKSKYFFAIKILTQVPKILWCIYQEHLWLKKIILKEKINVVISDNRFGLFSKQVPTIFITHQLQIQAPFKWLEWMIQKINYSFINHYQQCWVPDIKEENNIAGKLSHPKNLPQIPTHYIGNLSRVTIQPNTTKEFDVCILLSGPEPQRTLLEEKLLLQLNTIKNKKIIFIRGLPKHEKTISMEAVEIHNHLQQKELEQVLNKSEFVVSRSGYTTVMELISLQKKAILIPTPGQTEQEYLAKHLADQNYCLSYDQNVFNIENALQEAASYSFNFNKNINYNEQMILDLMNKLLQ
jgi:uncharacterized protein (TIGR00661 family)